MKIGSTSNFVNRMSTYVTSCPDFNNESHEIYSFELYNPKYNCYQLDDLINKLSTKHEIPYKKYDADGGVEFYYKNAHVILSDFLNKIGVKHLVTKVDVDDLRNEIKILGRNNKLKPDDNKIFHSINKEDFTQIELMLKPDKEFILKPYQKDIKELVSNTKIRLQHLIISPTGTGKTVIFTLILCDKIMSDKKDVIIVTKKKEILNQMPKRIDDLIQKFIKNKIVENFECVITNCLKSCSTAKLNIKLKIPQIYIVNWDKFTSSTKTNYKDIDWSKFSTIIIDESHHCGSSEIYNVLSYVKSTQSVNYIGLSATPIRFNKSNQANILDLFGTGSEHNILYEYSYYQALTNKDICPIKYIPIEINLADLTEDNIGDDNIADVDIEDIDNSANGKIFKILSTTAYDKVWTQIKNTIIKKTHFRKGIFWFRCRKDMLDFYVIMKNKIKDFELLPTMSISGKEKKSIDDLVKKTGLKISDFNNAINKFLSLDSNAILLSVMRATEGFDDDKLEFGIRMYYSNTVDPLNESQKMGRFNRWYANEPNKLKTHGYYASLEISDNKEEIKKSLILRFRSWIAFAKTHKTNSSTVVLTVEKIHQELKELINTYVDTPKNRKMERIGFHF